MPLKGGEKDVIRNLIPIAFEKSFFNSKKSLSGQ